MRASPGKIPSASLILVLTPVEVWGVCLSQCHLAASAGFLLFSWQDGGKQTQALSPPSEPASPILS